MGRRRADLAASLESTPAEAPSMRRSSRLAVKERIDYNETRLFKAEFNKAMENYSGKKKVAPRTTKKEKTKLKKGGAMAVRIVHETFTTIVQPPQSQSSSSSVSISKAPITRSRTKPTTLAALTSITSMTSSINETPVSTRKKMPSLRGRVAAAALATLAEVDPSVPSTSGYSTQSTTVAAAAGRPFARAPATITPESLQVASPTSFRKRPSKLAQKKAPTVSPEDPSEVPRGRGREPRATRLFDDVDDGVADALLDDTMAAADDTMLAVEPEIFVPEKRRKKDTVVAKKVPAAKIGAASKKARATPSPKAAKTAAPKRQVRAPSMIMQRVQHEDFRSDDYYAGQYSGVPGALDRSVDFSNQLLAGTISAEDLPPDDRFLAELFSPIKSPRLDASLAAGIPLVLSSSASPPAGRKGRRAAAAKAEASLSDHFLNQYGDEDDVDDEEEEDELSSLRGRLELSDAAYARSANRLKRSPYIRALFAASAAKHGGSVESTEKTPQPRQRKKIQYPGIAPLPEEDEEAAEAESRHERQLSLLDGLL